MLRPFAIILLALSLAGTALSQPPAPAPSERGQEPQSQTANTQLQPAGDHQATKPPPVTTVEQPKAQDTHSEPAPDTNNRDNKSSGKWGLSAEKWIALFTGGLFVVTFSLAVFTGFLACYTAKLWRSTSRLVTGSEETAKRQLRAYIFIHDNKMDFKGGIGNFHIIFKNCGQTPAYNVTTCMRIFLEDYPLVVDLPPAIETTGRPVGPGTIQTIFERTNKPLTDQEHGDIIAARKAIYVYGSISYVDIFTAIHTIRFRYLAIGHDLGIGKMRVAEDGNEEVDG